MPNDIFRARLINKISYAIEEAENAKDLNHSLLTGKVRESVSGDLIAPMLPTGFEVASGKIVDYLGNQSAETNVIIHNPTVLPPILYTEKDGVFPVESSYYAMEVKSKFLLRQ